MKYSHRAPGVYVHVISIYDGEQNEPLTDQLDQAMRQIEHAYAPSAIAIQLLSSCAAFDPKADVTTVYQTAAVQVLSSIAEPGRGLITPLEIP